MLNFIPCKDLVDVYCICRFLGYVREMSDVLFNSFKRANDFIFLTMIKDNVMISIFRAVIFHVLKKNIFCPKLWRVQNAIDKICVACSYHFGCT